MMRLTEHANCHMYRLKHSLTSTIWDTMETQMLPRKNDDLTEHADYQMYKLKHSLNVNYIRHNGHSDMAVHKARVHNSKSKMHLASRTAQS